MITKEEYSIREWEGGKNPFRVPEGYFEHFNERLASRLPQPERQKTIRLRPRLWRYAVAVVLLLSGTVTALYWTSQSQMDEVAQQEEYYNDALDYFMVNNMEIAEYLTAAE